MKAKYSIKIQKIAALVMTFAFLINVNAQQLQIKWEKQFVKTSTLESHIFPVMMDSLQDSLNPSIVMVNALDHQAEIFKIDTASNQIWNIATDTFICSHISPLTISKGKYMYSAISSPTQFGISIGDLMLISFDENGNMSNKVFTASNFTKLTSSHSYTDSSILLVGNGFGNVIISHIDTNGQEIWQKVYQTPGSTNTYNANLSVLAGENILFSVTDFDNAIPVVCLDADSGKIKWEMKLRDSLPDPQAYTSSPISITDGQYYYLAFHLATQNTTSLVINKIDTAGNLLYQHIHKLINNSNYLDLNDIQIDKKSIILSISTNDSIYLTQLNKSTGQLDWKKVIEYTHLGRGFLPYQQIVMNDNYVIMSYSNNLDTTNMDVHISIFDRVNGNALYQTVFNTSGKNSNDSPFQLAKSSDNKVFILGASDNPNMSISSEEIQSFLLCYEFNQITALKAYSNAQHKLQLFPNPVQDYLTISNGKTLDAEVVIFDSQGKLVKKIPVQKTKSKLRISTSSLQAGIYFILLKDGKDMHQAKFVKY